MAYGIASEKLNSKNSIYIGNPVRNSVLNFSASPYIPPGDYPINVLVIGGSRVPELCPTSYLLLYQNCQKRI